jgi:peptidyl-dipeptidase A
MKILVRFVIVLLAFVTPLFAQTAADAERFVLDAEQRLAALGQELARAEFVQKTYITEDTQYLLAAASERYITAAVEYAKGSTKYDRVQVSPDVRRKLNLLKQGLTSPAPSDPAKTRELTTIAARMDSAYGEGKYCPEPGKCLDIQDITRVMLESRDPAELLRVWKGWHAVGAPMRADYQRFAELMNEGARELGFKDVGALWRSGYDMPPDAFAAEVDRLYSQVKPLYESLHCHVRAKLNEKYGDAVVAKTGPIPAHLLGNIWAQDWTNIYDLVAPPSADPGYNLNEILQTRKPDAKEMVRYGERFFVSLGFDPLPETFFTRSLLVKPRDREVVCHASATNPDEKDDLRIKMCIEPTADDFKTIHHELGHNIYQRAYKNQSFMFRNSANDGFHEAVGDTIAMSVTPKYLKDLGFIEREPDPSRDLGLLMRDALDMVAFLPWGVLVDKWRWGVFSGDIQPSEYNAAWWELREKYQGVGAPVTRTEADFDPGAKYHIPGNTPYARYFLARFLQFQFHRALCQTAGYSGPLNRCSIYGNKEAGAKLARMLEMGASKPWPDALEAVTGQRQMDATAVTDYFKPLKSWLDQQNRGRKCGW